MRQVKEALKTTRQMPPQTPVQIMRGLTVRRTRGGIPVVRLHYTADPNRDPELNPAWKEVERRTYSSQASWDREQEIIDEAGGGELVFADTLVTHWNKIVITDRAWRPDPNWALEGGFDHGRTNPTAFERCYVDYEGTIFFCGEYYMPGREVWEHAPTLKSMADIRKVRVAYADPTIFDQTMQQANQPSIGKAAERAKSINELYVEQGIELFAPFRGDRSDISFAARLLLHWANLDVREPTVRIVCPDYSERPQPGLHNWSCPNLLWELMRARRQKLTALQLLSRNASEAIVDKDNHARDVCKYIIMSHPEPAGKTPRQLAAEVVRPLAEAGDLTSASIRYQQLTCVPRTRPIRLGRYRGRRY
jgi:hypothetical protein